MYHRFHAPCDCRVEQVNYISGDTWNVNPIALRRIERLFCKNARAVIRCRLPSGALLTLVPKRASVLKRSPVARQRRRDASQHRHAYGHAVVDLFPDDGARAIGDFRGYFDTPIHRPGMHDEYARRG